MKHSNKGDTPLHFPKFENEESMSATDICLACTGCCRYITIEIDKPKKKETIDYYTWYLLHQNVQIYIDNENAWNLLFITPCTKLQANGMCAIYEKRPDICKDYSADSCSRTGKDHKVLFQTPEEMLNYLQSKKTKKQKH